MTNHGTAPVRVSETTYDALELDWSIPSRSRIAFGRGHQHVWDDHRIDAVTERVLEGRSKRRDQLDKKARLMVDRDCGRLLLAAHDMRST